MERTPQTSLDDEESYETIERAVMETARGRWFLAEFALRNRQSETVTLLNSISRLERVIGRNGLLEGTAEWRTQVLRLSNDLELLLAAMMGDVEHPAKAQEKLQNAIAESQKSCVDMAVLADSARDLMVAVTAQDAENIDLSGLDLKLSELVRLSAEHMASMRRFEALSEIVRHVRGRLAEILQSSALPIVSDSERPPAANDQTLVELLEPSFLSDPR
jgi:hypothetical protein